MQAYTKQEVTMPRLCYDCPTLSKRIPCLSTARKTLHQARGYHVTLMLGLPYSEQECTKTLVLWFTYTP